MAGGAGTHPTTVVAQVHIVLLANLQNGFPLCGFDGHGGYIGVVKHKADVIYLHGVLSLGYRVQNKESFANVSYSYSKQS
jgi:hypothetical protein